MSRDPFHNPFETSDTVSLTINSFASCSFCATGHRMEEPCPKVTCASCGSSVTITARDRLDDKMFRRCFRCLTVEVWNPPKRD